MIDRYACVASALQNLSDSGRRDGGRFLTKREAPDHRLAATSHAYTVLAPGDVVITKVVLQQALTLSDI